MEPMTEEISYPHPQINPAFLEQRYPQKNLSFPVLSIY